MQVTHPLLFIRLTRPRIVGVFQGTINDGGLTHLRVRFQSLDIRAVKRSIEYHIMAQCYFQKNSPLKLHCSHPWPLQ